MNAAFSPDEWASLLGQLKPVGATPVPVGLAPGPVLTTKKSLTFLVVSVRAGAGAQEEYVMKVYSDEGRAEREARVMQRLAAAGVTVPEIVAVGERALLRRHVAGRPLRELDIDERSCRELASWLYRCHAVGTEEAKAASTHAATWLVGDMNLGNFIVGEADGSIWGIDFGDTRLGDPYDDVGEGAMRILLHTPAFSEHRWRAAVAFVECYGGLESGGSGGEVARMRVVPPCSEGVSTDGTVEARRREHA